jgi:hypothetical protein
MGCHLRVGIFLAIGPQPPRPPQQFSIRKFVRRFTLSKSAEYEIDRPFFFGCTRPVAAKTFRWNESVGPGSPQRRAILPAGRPLGAWRTSKRKMSSRVDCANAASELITSDCFIIPNIWKYRRITGSSQSSFKFLIANAGWRKCGVPTVALCFRPINSRN